MRHTENKVLFFNSSCIWHCL